MRYEKFIRRLEQDFPEFLEVINNDPDDPLRSGSYKLIYELIKRYKCPYITTRTILTTREFEFLFRMYTIELLQERKDYIYFMLIL